MEPPDKGHEADEAFGNVSAAPSELFSGPRVDEHMDEAELVRLAGRRILAWAEHNHRLIGLLDVDGRDLAMGNAGAGALGDRRETERRRAGARRRVNPRADHTLYIVLEGEHAAGEADEDQEDRHGQARPAVDEDENLPHHLNALLAAFLSPACGRKGARRRFASVASDHRRRGGKVEVIVEAATDDVDRRAQLA